MNQLKDELNNLDSIGEKTIKNIQDAQKKSNQAHKPIKNLIERLEKQKPKSTTCASSGIKNYNKKDEEKVKLIEKILTLLPSNTNKNPKELTTETLSKITNDLNELNKNSINRLEVNLYNLQRMLDKYNSAKTLLQKATKNGENIIEKQKELRKNKESINSSIKKTEENLNLEKQKKESLSEYNQFVAEKHTDFNKATTFPSQQPQNKNLAPFVFGVLALALGSTIQYHNSIAKFANYAWSYLPKR